MDPAAMRARFVAAFAMQVDLDPVTLDVPGTTVVGTTSRAGTRAAVCYRVCRRAVLWCDPAVVSRLEAVRHAAATHDGPLPIDAVDGMLIGEGFGFVASAHMHILAAPPPVLPLPTGYEQRWLSADVEADVALVRAFVERSDPSDVEEAALDDMDHFAERAIHVLVDDGPCGDHIVAYASAADWTWDPLLADIGVLVDPAHRGRGLATFVVSGCAAALLRDGRVPLYRHELANVASAAVAASVGFEPVATLVYHLMPDPDA